MQIYFKSLLDTGFAKELNQYHNRFLEEKTKIVEIVITDEFAKNVAIFGYYITHLLDKTELRKIKFLFKTNEIDLDPLFQRKIMSHLKKYLTYYLNFVVIEFPEIDKDEILKFLGIRNYLNYVHKNRLNIEFKDDLIRIERERAKKYSNLFHYKSFIQILDILSEFPFAFINYPIQKGFERFVFYTYIYSQKQKNILLDYIKKNSLDREEYFQNLIKRLELNKDIYYVALGLRFKKNSLDRFTFYAKIEPTIIEKGKLKQFLKEKLNLNIRFSIKNVWYFGIDYNFQTKTYTYKLYDEPYIFNQKLEDPILNKTLWHKDVTKVYKIRDDKLILTKYEFDLKKVFNKEEIKILKRNNLYEEDKQVLSIYLKDKEIEKYVLYNMS